MSGVPFSLELIRDLVKKFPKIIVGMKDSSGDLENMKMVQSEIPDFAVFSGTEYYMLDLLEAGGAGCITATANIHCALIRQVFDRWHAGEDTSELNKLLKKARSAYEGLPLIGLLKAFLARKTKNRDWLNIIPPNIIACSDDLIKVDKRLLEAGVF